MDQRTTPDVRSAERNWHIKRAGVSRASKKERFLQADQMTDYACWSALQNRLDSLELYLRQGSSVAHYGDVRIAQELAAELKERGTQLQLGGF